jgi:hypothetical protein
MGDFWVVRWGQVGCGKTNKYTISFQELNAYEREKKLICPTTLYSPL